MSCELRKIKRGTILCLGGNTLPSGRGRYHLTYIVYTENMGLSEIRFVTVGS